MTERDSTTHNEQTVEVSVSPQKPPLVTTSVDTVRADRRRDWAVWLLFLAFLINTVYATVVLIKARHDPNDAMWLGLAAHANTFVVLSAIGGLLVKRHLEIDRTGLRLDDRDRSSGRDHGEDT